MSEFENEEFYGCQLVQMSKAYTSVLRFSKVMDCRDFARFVEDMNDQIKGRKIIQYLEDNRKQIIVVVFNPELDSSLIDNKIRQIIATCSPNLRVSF